MHDVAIIGAGLSGLSAGSLLASAGLDVVILEKSRYPGGRASTRRVELSDGRMISIDHGAQFFTARDPLFLKLVDRWISKGVCFEWTRGFHAWDGSSLHPYQNDLVEPRYACHRGMRSLGEDLGANLKTKLDYHVASIKRNGGAWTLFPDDPASGDPVQSKAVFSSLPIPQSLALTGDHLSRIELDLLKTHHYGECLALMAVFEGMSVLPDWHGIRIRDPESSLSWMSFDSSKRNGSGLPVSLVLHALPGFSARNEMNSESGRIAATQLMLRHASLIGGDWILNPTSTFLHRWKYAIPLGKGFQGGFFRSTLNDSLYLIGDGLSGGRIEGAWLSGFHAATHFCTTV